MSLRQQGIDGEQMGRRILRDIFKQTNIQQIDWAVFWNGKIPLIVEVKCKDLYTPPPFYGCGLDVRQIELRTQFLKLGIDTILFEIAGNDLFYARLSKLEKTTDKFTTKNGIRIYNIKHFERKENFRDKLKPL